MSMTRALTKPETWCLIGTFLDTSDLNELCQTCRSLLHALRPFLFRDLNLTLEMEYKDTTLKLLCTNKRLASRVQTFTFDESDDEIEYYKPKEASNSHGLFIKAIGNMTRLHTLRLRDVVFAGTSEEKKFLDQIQNRGIPLRTFDFHAKVVDDFTGSSKKGHLQSRSFPLANLTSLIWDESGDDDGSDDGFDTPSAALMSVLEASRETLQDITLGQIPYWQMCTQLWNLHFPSLRSLTFGEWINEGDAESGAEAFTEFILKHDETLEEIRCCTAQQMDELDFGWESSVTPFTVDSGLETDSLPYLKVLRCSVSTFKNLVQLGLNSLHNSLEKLELTSTEGDRESVRSDWGEICDALQGHHVLRHLKELALNLQEMDHIVIARKEAPGGCGPGDDPELLAFTSVAPFFACCRTSKLEVLKLNFRNFHIEKEHLAEALRPLGHLEIKTIYIPSSWAGDETNHYDQRCWNQCLIWEIAEVLPRLQNVWIAGLTSGYWVMIERNRHNARVRSLTGLETQPGWVCRQPPKSW